jgi:2-oxoglutarate dehydrogenase complex dehydrogenase (E1) component-like enzyme
VKRVLLCTGKIYYELVEERVRAKYDSVAIVRLEQLYPIYPGKVAELVKSYPNAREVVWVQEEPSNMGAHRFVRLKLARALEPWTFRCVSRVESASPATGSHKAHLIEQAQILARAFAPITELEGD